MFISSLHFSGPVPPCIRTDTASDYRTTFFKGPEVNVPVFCIIKVITHRGHQRFSLKGGLDRQQKDCASQPTTCVSRAGPKFGQSPCAAVTDHTGRPQVSPQASLWVRLCIRSCVGSRDRLGGTHISNHREDHDS